jgi:hypothetical protein
MNPIKQNQVSQYANYSIKVVYTKTRSSRKVAIMSEGSNKCVPTQNYLRLARTPILTLDITKFIFSSSSPVDLSGFQLSGKDTDIVSKQTIIYLLNALERWIVAHDLEQMVQYLLPQKHQQG